MKISIKGSKTLETKLRDFVEKNKELHNVKRFIRFLIIPSTLKSPIYRGNIAGEIYIVFINLKTCTQLLQQCLQFVIQVISNKIHIII